MSEIKGQILGVVLVLSIFGAIGTVLVTAFKNSADSIASKITAEDKLIESSSTDSTNKTNNYEKMFNDFELLKY